MVRLAPASSGRTVRRTRPEVPGCTATRKLCPASTFGPVIFTSTRASPGPAAVIGIVTALLAPASSRIDLRSASAGASTGPRTSRSSVYSAAAPSTFVDLHMETRLVADREEARQGAGEHDRIAHDHVGARAADAVGGPGDRHHPHGAVEGRDVEAHLRRAVRPDPHHARVARERLLGRRDALQAAVGAVAARADRAARALHAVDQIAVEVADLGRELLLAEEVVDRVRRLVAGEVEDADIDRGDRDARLLAGLQPGKPDRQAHRRRAGASAPGR